jgi:3-hydroxyacyl-CoA dehydrogenase/enoyl-CoA hydratase/3-hydroxybutyryl-CoA epimerase
MDEDPRMTFFATQNVSIELQGPIAFLWLDVHGRPLNVLGRQVIADLEGALACVEAEHSIQCLFIGSRKPTGFLAGADIEEFADITTAEQAMQTSERGQKLMDCVARLRVPTVACISGFCLGGGLELALACDYRLVYDTPNTQLGLPEIKLGLLPGWGGTQRLPRVVGLERALQIILQQRTLNAREAMNWGLADFIERDPAQGLTRALPALRKRPKAGMPLHGWRQKLLESTSIGRNIIFKMASKAVHAKAWEDMPAPVEALEAIRVGLTQGMEAGLRREREGIGRLAITRASRNLITIFFLVMSAKKSEEKTLPCKKVGVVGAGTMGAGIAQLALLKGFDVVVQEINDGALTAGMKKIEDLVNKAVERRLLTADEARKKLAGIGRTTSYQGFESADIVIEAAIEDLDKKRDIFRLLDERCRPDAVLATNTSSLSVKQLQEGLRHPRRVAGLHFFNPVHKMMLVEVVRTPTTDEAVTSLLVRFAASLGKTPVVCSDSPGFIVNRILTPYLNEAGILIGEGLPVKAIDRTMERFGMPMGPLELLDTVGLDVAAHVSRSVGPAFGERLKPHPALPRMCEHGWLGQKTGKGFYLYSGKKKEVNAEALARLGAELGMKPPLGPVPDEQVREARERMVCLMVNEAAACLSEGLAERADVIDLAMVLGTGWAPHRGGPLRYADDRGAADIVRALEDLARRHGPRFEPCAELRRRAKSGELFYSTLPKLQMAS